MIYGSDAGELALGVRQMIGLWFRFGVRSANDNVNLARHFGREVFRGASYSRETLARSYFALKTGNEQANISEGWIDVMWKRIAHIPLESWKHAARSRNAFVDFVHGFWGKDL